MLADTGILGLAWYVAFLLISLYKALDIEDRSSRNATVATMVGYMILGLFEARSVNGGNPMSLFWQFSCFFALAQWKGVFLRPAAYLPPLGTPPLARPSN
jgi:hypothetical protein